jgi:hypothetical protein
MNSVSGFKSSEFWLTVLVFLALLTKRWTQVSTEEIMSICALVGIFAGGRSLVKARYAATPP